MADEVVDELLPRSEVFRSKLIEDFQLLDVLNAKGNTEGPRYYSNEISGSTELMDIMMRECPHSLVKFQVYNKRVEMTYTDRRLNRIKTKNSIPFGPWARMIVTNNKVQNLLLALILVNSIVLGIQAEFAQSDDPSVLLLKLFLDIIDYISLVMFILEILLKWIDGFWKFWRNGWNIFDFFVTIMSFVPEIIKVAFGNISAESVEVIAENLRVFRILRSLKMVSRFAQLRMIVLTILKAFKSMAFILILLTTIMYVFAVAGTVMFASYSKSNRTDLKFKSSFSTLVQSFITLFQLFTLDHWFEILNDLTKVADGIGTKIYIILWICIGAFIFRNIFAGIMVMNFQNIRNDFAMQCKEKEKQLEDEQMQYALEEELAKQYRKHSSVRRSSVGLFASSQGKESIAGTTQMPKINEEGQNGFRELQQRLSRLSESSGEEGDEGSMAEDHDTKERNETSTHGDTKAAEMAKKDNATSKNGLPTTLLETGNENIPRASEIGIDQSNDDFNSFESEYKPSEEWNSTVRGNLHNLATNNHETLWPRDTLFRYFQLMEALQENLAERQQLQRLAGSVPSQVHPTYENKR